MQDIKVSMAPHENATVPNKYQKAPHAPVAVLPNGAYCTLENSHFCSVAYSDVTSSPRAHGVRVTTAPSSMDLCSTSRHSSSAGGGVSSVVRYDNNRTRKNETVGYVKVVEGDIQKKQKPSKIHKSLAKNRCLRRKKWEFALVHRAESYAVTTRLTSTSGE